MSAKPSRMPRIVAGFAESLAAPETIWSLRDAGFDVVAFSRRGARPALRYSKSQRILRIEQPEVDVATALADLEQHLVALDASAGLPLDDAAVWLFDQLALRSSLRILGPTAAQARFALDKEVQIADARDAGFAVPKTDVASASDLAAVGREVAFPAYVRPAAAIESHGGRLVRRFGGMCADTDELARIVAPLGNARVLVQPLVRGKSHGLFGFFDDGELLAVHAHERVRMAAPSGSGSSACRPAAVPDELLQPVRKLLTSVGWSGMFMVELIRDQHGKWWFIEFNGRPWGSMALARDIGAEYPEWVATRALLNPAFQPPAIDYDGHAFLCRHLGRDVIHLLSVLRGRRSRAAVDWPARGRTLRDVLFVRRSDRWYNARRGETRVLVYDSYRTVTDFLRGFIRRRVA